MLNSEMFNDLSVDINDRFGRYVGFRIHKDRNCFKSIPDIPPLDSLKSVGQAISGRK